MRGREEDSAGAGVPRWAVALAVVGCVVAGVSVAAASEPSADVTVKALASNVWDQPSVSIATGDTVTWDMNSGNGDPAQRSEPDGPAGGPELGARTRRSRRLTARQSYMFTQPGTYTYLCDRAPGTMTGTVTVTGAPATPTPTTTATATPTPTATAADGHRRDRRAAPTSATPDHTTPAPAGSRPPTRPRRSCRKLRLKAVARGAQGHVHAVRVRRR